jgi:hypothetical protein
MATQQQSQYGQLKGVFHLMKYTFVIVPIVAGLDKFTDILVQWENYLNPGMVKLLPFTPHHFMEIVGVIEFVAGIIVFKKPRLGGLIVAAWLALIALTLLGGLSYLDVAVRDLVMAISAYCMAKLSRAVA